MAKFRVTELSFINNELVEPGRVIDFDGEPGKNLEPVDKAATAAAKKAAVPKAVSDLVNSVKLHAATRGDIPTNANDEDFGLVIDAMTAKPSDDVVAQAKAIVAAQAKAVAAGEATDELDVA